MARTLWHCRSQILICHLTSHQPLTTPVASQSLCSLQNPTELNFVHCLMCHFRDQILYYHQFHYHYHQILPKKDKHPHIQKLTQYHHHWSLHSAPDWLLDELHALKDFYNALCPKQIFRTTTHADICMFMTCSAHLPNHLKQTVVVFNSETPLALLVEGLLMKG